MDVSYSLEVRQSAVLQFFYLSQLEKIKIPGELLNFWENCWPKGSLNTVVLSVCQIFSSAVNLRAEPGFSSRSSSSSYLMQSLKSHRPASPQRLSAWNVFMLFSAK